ncbi:MAG: TPM domain-containing protein [Cryobacterium sp.]|nr:TPM domain-containing protein [Cryobacterium sp.]
MVDEVGVLTGREAELEQSLDALANEGVLLFVVVVDSFTGVSLDDNWAAATADLNRFGDRDVLFAIAVDDRNYAVDYPAGFALSKSQTDRLEELARVPHLRNNDYAGALVAFADGMRAELAAEAGGSGGTDVSGGSGGGIPINWPIVGGVVAVGGGGLYVYSRIRKKKALDASKLNQKELDVRAGGLLVQLDDQIKTSEQDLSFATAEFGEAAVKPFATVLEGAKAKLREAFEIRQKLDDAFPEPPDEKRTLTLKIVELCEAADAELDAQADAFDELRELEKNAPTVLATAKNDAATARESLAAARTRLTALGGRYSDAAIASIAANPDQAKDLLDFADTHLVEAQQALDEGESGLAAVAVHTAQASIGQVRQLVAAIDGLAANLDEATSALSAIVADTKQDLAAARALPDASDSRLSQTIVEAEVALDEAIASRDPLTSLASLQNANARLDSVLESARERHEHVQAAARSLDHALASARSEIAAANDYITTRRGGIGDGPRTRVSEAMRRLDSAVALAGSDPVEALAEARAATGLAQNALASAQSEVRAIQNQGNYGGGAQGSDIGGAILGGIIGSWLGGGSSSSRSSWSSGSSSGSSSWGGSSRGGFSSGGSRSGSFGGSSRRPSSSASRGGRRSSGGRF